MIHITGDYFLEADNLNLTLKKRKIAKTGQNAGQEVFTDIGYYGTFEQLLDRLVEKRIKIDVQGAQSLTDVCEGVKLIHDDIKEFCARLKNEIKQRLEAERNENQA